MINSPRISVQLSKELLAAFEEITVNSLPTHTDVLRSAITLSRLKNGGLKADVFVSENLSKKAQEFLVEQELKLAQIRNQSGNDQFSLEHAISKLAKQPQEDSPTVALSAVVIPESKSSQGTLIKAHALAWSSVVEEMSRDWQLAYQIPPGVWEEIVAGAFHLSGFDEVTLTPRSGDHGRDVIAVKRGVGSIKIISSVKAYEPKLLVGYDDIRALLGVMSGERDTSKGIIVTTSGFPPKIKDDPFIAPFLPTRLELVGGSDLQKWLSEISSTHKARA